MKSLRILSLLPAATEIIYLLGLEKYLVGVSHECDWPPEVKKKPKVTYSEVTNAMSSREIDKRVKNLVHKGPGVFHIKEGVLKKLRPNLILTQELCEVCALTPFVILRSGVTKDLKFKRAESRDSSRIARNDNFTLISLEPESVEDILQNILLIGELSGKNKESSTIVNKLKKRLEKLNSRFLIHNSPRPKVLVIEWLDPIMVAGHWVPQMVKLAGGINLISKTGEKSKRIKVHQIIASRPDILVISPCGFDIDRGLKERFMINDLRLMIGNKKTKFYLVDGNSYMTRPGPRIIDGIEILSEIIHPEIYPRRYTKRDWVKFA